MGGMGWRVRRGEKKASQKTKKTKISLIPLSINGKWIHSYRQCGSFPNCLAGAITTHPDLASGDMNRDYGGDDGGGVSTDGSGRAWQDDLFSLFGTQDVWYHE